jgi:pimeloyl-ACP methyl ester carboxylesterase
VLTGLDRIGDSRFVASIEGEGPNVVLLHGFPDTPHGFEAIQRALVEAGHRTIVPWLRGYHADTIVPGRRYDLDTLARDVIDLMNTAGAGTATVIGHDWGALIAYGVAAVAPERVTRIVALGLAHPATVPRSLTLTWAGRHFIRLKLPAADGAVRRRDFAYLERLFRRWSPSWTGAARDDTLDRGKQALSDPRTLNAAISYYRDFDLRRPPKAMETFPTVPGLIVGGTEDPVMVEPTRETARRLPPPSRAVVYDGAGHWPHRENEQEFVRDLLSFLNAQQRG